MPNSSAASITFVDDADPKRRSPKTWLALIGTAALLVFAFSPRDKTTDPRKVETTVRGSSVSSDIVAVRTGDRPYRLR